VGERLFQSAESIPRFLAGIKKAEKYFHKLLLMMHSTLKSNVCDSRQSSESSMKARIIKVELRPQTPVKFHLDPSKCDSTPGINGSCTWQKPANSDNLVSGKDQLSSIATTLYAIAAKVGE
jgi:hypothetical protein